MCLAAEVPLIESGTTGFNGQVQVIIKVRKAGTVSNNLADRARAKPNAMIATRKRCQRVSRFARYEAHRVSLFIA